MKKLILFYSIVLSSTFSYAANNTYEKTFSNDTRTVTISTTVALPTLLLTNEAYDERTWIVNASTLPVSISSSTAGLSTSTSFQIPATPANATPVIWSPDGVNAPYSGPMYAVGNVGGTPQSLSVFRAK